MEYKDNLKELHSNEKPKPTLKEALPGCIFFVMIGIFVGVCMTKGSKEKTTTSNKNEEIVSEIKEDSISLDLSDSNIPKIKFHSDKKVNKSKNDLVMIEFRRLTAINNKRLNPETKYSQNTPNYQGSYSESETPNADGYDFIPAYVAAKEYVRQRIKSPSTAEFAPATDITGVKKSKNTFVIESWVDSKNSFGALIRTRFICQITFHGDNPKLDYLKFDE